MKAFEVSVAVGREGYQGLVSLVFDNMMDEYEVEREAIRFIKDIVKDDVSIKVVDIEELIEQLKI